MIVYKIPYRRARAWPSGRVRRASKGILHTTMVTAKANSPTVVIIKEQSAALTRAIIYCSHSMIFVDNVFFVFVDNIFVIHWADCHIFICYLFELAMQSHSNSASETRIFKVFFFGYC